MRDALRTLMKAIEANPDALPAKTSGGIRFAALAGLGSKYLAVGSPASIGLVHCGAHSEGIAVCHELLFGPLEVLHDQDVGVEEAMAADIVCLPSSTEFELAWIAEATHLNILDDGHWSKGMIQLANHCRITYAAESLPTRAHKAHGLLADVVRGSVSGRMGEEFTALVC